MDKQSFIKEYNIRDALPINPSTRAVPAEGFAQAIEEFINLQFRGVARAKSEVVSYAAVMVCTEYVAYFFKTLLTEIYGRCFLNVALSSSPTRLSIIIDADGELPLSEKQVRNLTRLARSARMNVFIGTKTIRLSIHFADAVRMRIYAISVNDGRRIMLGKLVELFYSGELIDTEKPKNLLDPRPKRRRSRST